MARSSLLWSVVVAVLVAGCVQVDTSTDEGPESPGRAETPANDVDTEPAAVPTVPPLHPSVDDYPEALVSLGGSDDVEIAVKLADTPERREHGLMQVESLPDDTGMLFLFDNERTGGFWMKNTLVPLDIAYADADGTIVSILSMQPCTADPCEVYTPDGAYQTALEVPQGWFDRVGIAEGDTLSWELLEPTG